jgi:hypothetical protein
LERRSCNCALALLPWRPLQPALVTWLIGGVPLLCTFDGRACA